MDFFELLMKEGFTRDENRIRELEEKIKKVEKESERIMRAIKEIEDEWVRKNFEENVWRTLEFIKYDLEKKLDYTKRTLRKGNLSILKGHSSTFHFYKGSEVLFSYDPNTEEFRMTRPHVTKKIPIPHMLALLSNDKFVEVVEMLREMASKFRRIYDYRWDEIIVSCMAGKIPDFVLRDYEEYLKAKRIGRVINNIEDKICDGKAVKLRIDGEEVKVIGYCCMRGEKYFIILRGYMPFLVKRASLAKFICKITNRKPKMIPLEKDIFEKPEIKYHAVLAIPDEEFVRYVGFAEALS